MRRSQCAYSFLPGNVNYTSNRERAAGRIDTSLRDTRHAEASWNVFAKSEIKWKQNGNKQPLSCAPGVPQVAPGVADFCFVSPFAWWSRWRVPPLHSTASRAQNTGTKVCFQMETSPIKHPTASKQRQPPHRQYKYDLSL